MIDLNRMIQELRKHTDYHGMGMIASHLGIVRGTSLNGQAVMGIQVMFNDKIVNEIIREIKYMPGIIDVLVETNDGRLDVGDDIMAVVVGGDTREHVFPALVAAVEHIKTRAVEKTELC